jgi:polyprenyldihydroxybenzoate methyltransferase / 3-demethylubiquinol 3-O-methyltransferase
MKFSPQFNVDANDVNFMSSFAADWWNPKGGSRGLHEINHVRVPFIRDGLVSMCKGQKWKLDEKSDVLKNFKVLDVGCGAGVLSEALGKLSAEVVGIDPATDLIEVARNHLSMNQHRLNVSYFDEILEDHLIENSEKYDAVIASEVIEHIVNKEIFLESCVKALKPGGSLFITTFNKNFLSWLSAIVFGENILGIIPKNTHQFDQFISPTEVTKIIENFNCRTVKVVGFRYEFFRSENPFRFQSSALMNYGLQAIKQSNSM